MFRLVLLHELCALMYSREDEGRYVPRAGHWPRGHLERLGECRGATEC